MRKLIIYAHPWEGSFNNFVKDEIEKLLNSNGTEIDIIDLYKDGFDPVMNTADLSLFSKGEYADKLALEYAERLKTADELIIIFPIWWYGEPAILKGFYDKVFLKGHVYEEVDHQLKGLLKAKKATVITTANINKKIFQYLGDPIQNVLAGGILKTVGVDEVKWIHCPTVHLEESRNEFLTKIEKHFA